MVKQTTFSLLLAGLCISQADAAVTLVQSATNSGANTGSGSFTVSLGSAPTTGHTLSIAVSSLTVTNTLTIKDSNSVALTLQQTGGVGSHGAFVFDYTVPSSPGTGTYTCTTATAGQCYGFSAFEISGSTSANYANASGSSSSIPTVSIGTQAGSLLECSMEIPATAQTVSITNAGTYTSLLSNADARIGYAFATATATSTCAGSANTSPWAIVMASYNPPASTTNKTCPPFSFPCSFIIGGN